MLAKESASAFDDEDWIFEIKWDGFRAIAEISHKRVELYSRNGNSFVHAYPGIVEALGKLKKSAVLDGEIVVLNEDGMPDFQKLQHYEDNTHLPLVYYVFDLLTLEARNLEKLPLLERKQLLMKLVGKNPVIRFSDHVTGTGKDFFVISTERNLEGIMAKKADSEYYPGRRTNEWLKIKNHKTADVIIAGYTAPGGSRNYFGSLVLGIYKGKILKYVGNAGTGYDEKKLKEIFDLLQPLKQELNPFKEKIKLPAVTWVKPQIVCEVKFTEWTRDEKLRHPVFLRIREDKKTIDAAMKDAKPVKKQIKTSNKISNKKEKRSVERLEPARASTGRTALKKNDEKELIFTFGKIKVPVSHPGKMYFPEDKITKGMVVEYYQSIAEYILPYIKNRPQSLKRNPGGIHANGFFHKDAGEAAPSFVKSFPVHSESSGKVIDYIICNDNATLAYLNNLGCIELNPWHSVTAKPDKPDYLIIDIDPSDKNTFDHVIVAANAYKKLLDKCGAKSYCKTSGASGLHIFVPMGKKYTYEQVKDFAHVLSMMVYESLPEFTTLERNLKKRGDSHIYLDYLQNRQGQTIASVYSLRPRVGATVSMPLQWKEVKKGLTPATFTIKNALARIKKTGDIFSGVLGPATDIKKCLELLGK